MKPNHLVWAFALTLLAVTAPAVMAAEGIADVFIEPQGIGFRLLVPDDGATLIVSGPRCFRSEESFERGENPVFEVPRDLRDGIYTYRLQVQPPIDSGTREILKRAREKNNSCIVWDLRDEGRLPGGPLIADGYFTVQRGKILLDEEEEGQRANLDGTDDGAFTTPLDVTAGNAVLSSSARTSAPSGDGLRNLGAADQVIPDDLIVDGSACIGFDCVNGESFGFDTIRLKENNLRIKFDDTSTAASFPRTDWQLTANDSANGGIGKFSIDDITGGRTPFTVEANAPSHSLYVDDGGRVGFGTSTPSVEAHIVDGDTPTLRLQQDGSSGFAPQTWDVAGNETNFFVRDVTGGSTLPFRIRPGAPSNSINIATGGNVGFGTASPASPVHIVRSTSAASVLLELTNNDPVAIQLNNTDLPGLWQIRRSGSGLVFEGGAGSNLYFDDGRVRLGVGGAGNESFLLATNGDLAIAGTLTENSDRDKKTNIVPVEQQTVLDKLMQLPIATWQRIGDTETKHLGPMAQDFHSLFGLGVDNRHIATIDTSGVALAAIQALNQKLVEKQTMLDLNQTKLEALEQQNSDLLKRLEALEAKLAQ